MVYTAQANITIQDVYLITPDAYGSFFYKPNNFFDLIIYIHPKIFFSLLGIKVTDTYIRIYAKFFFFFI